MEIRLTRLSNDRHRLQVRRAEGPPIERELETRSVLLHDLVHFALEAEAGLETGFWGRLAAGADFDELSEQAAAPEAGELMLVERLVGPMQALWQGRLELDAYVAMASPIADYVDRAFVERVLERLRRLWGQWKATPFHDSMLLRWPLP